MASTAHLAIDNPQPGFSGVTCAGFVNAIERFLKWRDSADFSPGFPSQAFAGRPEASPPYHDRVLDLMRLSLNVRWYRYNGKRRATVPNAADLKRKRADELNESVSARCLWLRRTVPT